MITSARALHDADGNVLCRVALDLGAMELVLTAPDGETVWARTALNLPSGP